MKSEIRNNINKFALKGKPFLLIVNYNMTETVVLPLEEAAGEGIFFNIKGITNFEEGHNLIKEDTEFRIFPVSYSEYLRAYEAVYSNLLQGNSYLTNLTFPTRIETNLTLKQIFGGVYAPFKLLYKDNFVCFSPEPFINIENSVISSYPMKGTIDAAIPDAADIILKDIKETAEHNTIVDLIRNDLNIVSENVRVEKFRYIEQIKTNRKNLLQVSSKICGKLDTGKNLMLGDILAKILPAGSVTGAPKKKTLEIISNSEPYTRGWYTGVFGIFDGNNFFSSVIIRYIEKNDYGMYFKSGGGITVNSDPVSEYNEMVNKVYVPLS